MRVSQHITACKLSLLLASPSNATYKQHVVCHSEKGKNAKESVRTVNKITYGKAKIEEAIQISVLLKTVFIEAYAIEGISFEFSNFVKETFSLENVRKIISEYPDQFLIAYLDANPIGVAQLLVESSCPIRKTSIPELNRLYVLKRFNGKGVGSRLMIESERFLKENNFAELYLEVFEGNTRAISFYEKLGYQKIGEVDFHLGTSTYPNWVMNKILK